MSRDQDEGTVLSRASRRFAGFFPRLATARKHVPSPIVSIFPLTTAREYIPPPAVSISPLTARKHVLSPAVSTFPLTTARKHVPSPAVSTHYQRRGKFAQKPWESPSALQETGGLLSSDRLARPRWALVHPPNPNPPPLDEQLARQSRLGS